MIVCPEKPITCQGVVIIDAQTYIRLHVPRDRPGVTLLRDLKTHADLGKVPTTKLHAYFAEFAPLPSIEELTGMIDEGGCESMTGQWVEPDGWDDKGFPSVLMAMGLI